MQGLLVFFLLGCSGRQAFDRDKAVRYDRRFSRNVVLKTVPLRAQVLYRGSLALMLALAALWSVSGDARSRWSPTEVNRWYAAQPWLIGSNYIPADAINQLEMWQADSFAPATIDRELGWAEDLGMNSMRVFLHDQLWQQDPKGFSDRINRFLAIAQRHHIRPMFVLFDSCWDPHPRLGPQHLPIPGVHNSGWVQSPGPEALADPAQRPRLEAYVKGVIQRFAHDDRILAWDVWNEPDCLADIYTGQASNKDELVAALLPSVFDWARAANPTQPLTSGVAGGDDWAPSHEQSVIQSTQLSQSDFITFHDYGWPEAFASRIVQLRGYGRPIVATEYMARGAGSTFDGVLPIAKRADVGVYNWGFVDGRTQTRLPWDSWKKPYTMDEPTIWFHDILHQDGTPYRPAETQLIRRVAGAPRFIVPELAR